MIRPFSRSVTQPPRRTQEQIEMQRREALRRRKLASQNHAAATSSIANRKS